jgi:hypothetical protein
MILRKEKEQKMEGKVEEEEEVIVLLKGDEICILVEGI